jgi:hypothetical protein
MAELKNTFCWSFSQAKEFAACPRRYYWQRYGSWGGWEDLAPKGVRLAYRLKQMKNRFALAGTAVDLAVKRALEKIKAGEEATFEESLEEASEYLRGIWIQHQEGRWQSNPKRYGCIKELYYNEFSPNDPEARAAWAGFIKERVEVCLGNFYGMILPRLRKYLANGTLVPLGDPESGGPESFTIGGIKIFALPDSVIQSEDKFFIIDWKTGRGQQFYAHQVEVYGIWAQVKHGVPPDMIELALVYLPDGTWQNVRYDEETARQTFDFIRESVRDISDKLKGGDLSLNEPLNMENFEQTDRLELCAHCNFMELCQRQFALTYKEEERHGKRK